MAASLRSMTTTLSLGEAWSTALARLSRKPRSDARARCPGSTTRPHDADASTEPGWSRDQKQPCPDGDDPDGSRHALTGRCETFDGDGCRHDSHRAKVHDPDDQEDRHQTETAVAAVEAEAPAVSPGRASVGRQRTAAPGRLPTVGEVTRLPRGELEGAGHKDGTPRANAGCCISPAASTTPSGKAAIPNTIQTKK